MNCARTPKICASSSSSLNALPGPLSSMQCRQARLHSLVTCHATYRGALRSADSCGAGASPARSWVEAFKRLILDQALVPQFCDERGYVEFDLRVAIIEALFEPGRDL